MNSTTFQDNLFSHSRWRRNLAKALEDYKSWRNTYGLDDTNSSNTLLSIIEAFSSDRVTLAFVAEFSRGKTELINSLFFAETGVRLLPSTAGRTTMSPTELFYDEVGGSYIRLLAIETRLEDAPLNVLKSNPARWKQINFDPNSSDQMQEVFKELIAVKRVPKADAMKLGLFDDRLAAELGLENADYVEIPQWRHALISFPHPLLKEGLAILDTPGLNALGSEPELTLSMLPSAQAIIFVIAADTGVTKSDMEMWTNHVNKATKAGRQGLAVVMNKIDLMWDDMTTDGNYQKSIQSQIAVTAKTLGISADFIFPVSAKQALLAKIKNDSALLERSKISDIEQYLAEDIIQQRQKILMGVIENDIGFLVTESFNLVENNYAKSFKQLEELKQLDFDNKDMIAKLVIDTKKQQTAYLDNLAQFKNSRDAFALQFSALMKALSPLRVEILIKSSKYEIGKSLTTHGMKQSMRKLFDDLRDLLNDCVESTQATQDLVKKIHKQFHDDYGFQEIEPKLFQIETYQSSLEQLFDDGEEFRKSTKITLTEQSLVVKKLYDTLIIKAYNIIATANTDAKTWGRNVMSPLMHQIMAYKKQLEDRLVVLNSSIESKENLKHNLERLDKELVLIIKQRNELNSIVKEIEGETSVFRKSASFLINDISRSYVDFL